MFGLLKHNKLSIEDYTKFRQNYCGTCKTIGKLYGQKERLFLNNDVVFLSELLAEINNCEDDFKNIRVNTCFSLPKEKKSIPTFLQYTASVNVLLAYYKVLDNIEDSKYRINFWQTIKSIEILNFNKAKTFLDSLGLNTEFISISIKQQFKRESNKKIFPNFLDTVRYYSELTGKITGEVFMQGAFVLSKPDLSKTLGEIGLNYGEIVYLADAIADYSKDIKKNNFNLFQLTKSEGQETINHISKEIAVNHIRNNLSNIQTAINSLPIPPEKKILFNSRLFEIVKTITIKHCKEEKHSVKKHIPIKERFKYALIISKRISTKRKNLILRSFLFIIIPLFLIILFLLFPQVIQAQGSLHEPAHTCCGKCCGDCLGCDSCCRSCCGDGQYTKDGCGGGRCGSENGDKFSETFCNWPGCLGCCGLPLIGLCSGGCSSGDSPKVITITKVIEVDRCGCK